MRKILKWLAIILGLMLVIFGVLFLIYNEPLPEGKKGPEAEALAQKMLQAVDKEAWDSTAVVQWSFAGMHSYLWDKERNYAQITWGDKKVLMELDEVSGKAYKEGVEQTDKAANKLIQQAWGFWCNDSFWFNAVVKCFDPGTSRSIVKLEDGTDGLMISYDSGGVTPGDSYLWVLDENGRPKSWKMWVNIIPIGGVEATWEDWVELSTGAQVAGLHKGLLDLKIGDIKGAASLEAFGLQEDPFAAIAD